MSQRWIIPDIHGCAQTLKVLLENMFSSCNGRLIETACADMHDACRYIDNLR